MKAKKSRRERDYDDGMPRGVGVDYSRVADRHIDDKRYERQRQGTASDGPKGPSLVLDTLVRMQAGLEGRTVAQKIADPNRPTWEQYKKENEDKLDIAGSELKKMVEYRKQLDAERERKLQERRMQKRQVVSSEDEDEDEDLDSDRDSSSKKKRKKKDKKRKDKKEKKKHKKHKKHRGRSRSRSRSGSRSASRSRSRSESSTRDRSRSRDRRHSSGSDSDDGSSRRSRHRDDEGDERKEEAAEASRST